MSWVKRIVDAYGKRSIGYKIRLSFLIMLIGIGVISTMTIASTHGFLEEYHVLSARITSANHLSPVAREDIGTEAYYLVVGRTTLQTTRLHDDGEMMDRVSANCCRRQVMGTAIRNCKSYSGRWGRCKNTATSLRSR